MHNLEEMDRFLEKFTFPRLYQEELEIISKPIINTEIETVTKICQKNKNKKKKNAQSQMASQANSIKYLEKS